MFQKINIWCVVRDHLDTLKNDNSDKAEFKDYLLFLIIPLVVPVLLILVAKKYLSDSLINILITVLSIFVGLLLNVMVVIFDIIKKNAKSVKTRLIKETYSNISFAILISIFTIIPLIGCYLPNSNDKVVKIILVVSNSLSYYFLGLFFITLLMIVRRIHIILSDEMTIDNESQKKETISDKTPSQD